MALKDATVTGETGIRMIFVKKSMLGTITAIVFGNLLGWAISSYQEPTRDTIVASVIIASAVTTILWIVKVSGMKTVSLHYWIDVLSDESRRSLARSGGVLLLSIIAGVAVWAWFKGIWAEASLTFAGTLLVLLAVERSVVTWLFLNEHRTTPARFMPLYCEAVADSMVIAITVTIALGGLPIIVLFTVRALWEILVVHSLDQHMREQWRIRKVLVDQQLIDQR